MTPRLTADEVNSMDTTIYRAVRLAYRLGRQDQQRILEHRLRKDLGADAQAKQIAELAAGMTDELVNFQAIILAAEKDSTEFNSLPDDATEVGLVNGPRRWTEDALREWHTQNCPRISEREASCFACSQIETQTEEA